MRRILRSTLPFLLAFAALAAPARAQAAFLEGEQGKPGGTEEKKGDEK